MKWQGQWKSGQMVRGQAVRGDSGASQEYQAKVQGECSANRRWQDPPVVPARRFGEVSLGAPRRQGPVGRGCWYFGFWRSWGVKFS